MNTSQEFNMVKMLFSFICLIGAFALSVLASSATSATTRDEAIIISLVLIIIGIGVSLREFAGAAGIKIPKMDDETKRLFLSLAGMTLVLFAIVFTLALVISPVIPNPFESACLLLVMFMALTIALSDRNIKFIDKFNCGLHQFVTAGVPKIEPVTFNSKVGVIA